MSDRDGLAFESAARQRGRPAAQRSGQRPDQPLLQHPHAANAPLVEEFPVGGEVRRFRQRQLLRKGTQYADEGLPIIGEIGAIARKVDINAPAAQLAIQVPERQKVIGAVQDVNRLSPVRDGFDYVQLVEQPPAGGDFGQMLRFVDHDRRRATKTKGLFQGVPVIAGGRFRPRRRPQAERSRL